MTPPDAGSGHMLIVVVDEWAAPPPPEPAVDVPLPGDPGWSTPAPLRAAWQRDILLSMRVNTPSALCVVSGV